MSLYNRFNKVMLLTLTLVMLPIINGCSQPQPDVSSQTIPTNSDHWQKKLGGTFERLPETDRQLLSRYMLRMKLSGAYESGAMPRITIKQALIQQKEYERLHPNNPTGKKSPIVTSGQLGTGNAQNYSVALLPVKASDSDSLNQIKLHFMLSNHGKVAIKSFKGKFAMKDKRLPKSKVFNVPLTQFKPPIEPEQTGKIIIESSIEDINVMRAIKNNSDISIEINEGKLVLVHGQEIVFKQSLAK
ncbi:MULTISPECIES: hypothetical protein [unclassified Psychrobacter]|uniref:hypothetical protein n=1 Tax=unclassified Psychrobacter TaxID=196806 RepID=UPI0025F04C01|nr:MULTISPECIES: hypothetical protein [unclassified Psychrobacter]